MTYTSIEMLHHDLLQCDRCVDAGCIAKSNPIFSGGPSARVMLVGQAPGIKNQTERFPFNGGNAGKRLFKRLAQAGWEEGTFRQHHYICSITRCYPGKNTHGRGDRVPSQYEQDMCTFWLENEITLLQPRLIIPMGKLSIQYFVKGWRTLADVIGHVYRYRDVHVVPLPHASGASTRYYQQKNKPLLEKAIGYLSYYRKLYNL